MFLFSYQFILSHLCHVGCQNTPILGWWLDTTRTPVCVSHWHIVGDGTAALVCYAQHNDWFVGSGLEIRFCLHIEKK